MISPCTARQSSVVNRSMSSLSGHGIQMLFVDAYDTLLVDTSPTKPASITRPMTPSVRKTSPIGSLTSSPASPSHSISPSMATASSSGSLASIASGASMAGYGNAVLNTFPYNIVKPTTPGRPLSPFAPVKRPTTPVSVLPTSPQKVDELSKNVNKRPRSSSSDTSDDSPAKKHVSPTKQNVSPPKDGPEVWPEDVERAFMEGGSGASVTESLQAADLDLFQLYACYRSLAAGRSLFTASRAVAMS